MYDPHLEYEHSEPTRPAKPAASARPIPCSEPAFCMECGRKLTPYTWTAVAGGTFCDDCAIDFRDDCLSALDCLPQHVWSGILVEVASVLWLSPEYRCFQFSPLTSIAKYLEQRDADEPLAAMRHLRTDAQITVAMSKANERVW